MKKYSLAQLEALLAISRLGTFNAAAKEINVTQPTISLRIKELEESLGTTFFDRNSRNASLSAEGVVAAQYAEQVFDLLKQMEARLSTGDPLQGTLRVGSCETVAIAGLPKAISQLGERYPGINVELTVGNSFVMADALNANRLDIAFLVDPVPQPQIHVDHLTNASIAWLGGSHKPLGTTVLRPAHLLDKTVVCVPPPSPLYDVITRWCASEQSRRPAVSTCNSLAMIARLVASGLAMSVLPTCILHDELQRGSVVRYRQDIAFEPLSVCAAYPRSSHSEGVLALVNIARRVLQETTQLQG